MLLVMVNGDINIYFGDINIYFGDMNIYFGEWWYKYILADIPAVVLVTGDLNSHLEFSMEPFNPQ